MRFWLYTLSIDKLNPLLRIYSSICVYSRRRHGSRFVLTLIFQNTELKITESIENQNTGIVADMGFPTFVADHGCVSSPPNMMIHMALGWWRRSMISDSILWKLKIKSCKIVDVFDYSSQDRNVFFYLILVVDLLIDFVKILLLVMVNEVQRFMISNNYRNDASRHT